MRDIDKYTSDYNSANFEDYQVIYRRKKVLEFVELYKPRKILEIGCGMEPLFKYLKEDYDEYTVIEPSSIFYQNAVVESKGNGKICCIHDFFGVNEEVYAKSYDMVICSGLLHEVENPDILIRELRKVCSDNTIIHINVPNANSFHRILAKAMGVIRDVHEMSGRNLLYQQHSVFDIRILTDIVESQGFRVIESGSYFVKPFTHGQMYRMMEAGIINEQVLDGLYNVIEDLPDMGSEIYVNLKI